MRLTRYLLLNFIILIGNLWGYSSLSATCTCAVASRECYAQMRQDKRYKGYLEVNNFSPCFNNKGGVEYHKITLNNCDNCPTYCNQNFPSERLAFAGCN